MADFELTSHARDMMRERRIPDEWVRRVVDSPDGAEKGMTDNIHYFKAIQECQGRFLHIVVNPLVLPKRVGTVFFDRRFGRQS